MTIQPPSASMAAEPRVAPPVLDDPGTLGSATVLVVDSDDSRRRRLVRALSSVPARIVSARSMEAAIVEIASRTIAVAIVEGREDPDAALDLLRRARATRPLLVSILVGIERSADSLLAAINDLQVFRVLPRRATEVAIRAAVLNGLRHERESLLRSRIDRHWVRALLERIESALPPGTISAIEEKGGALPFDLVLRRDA